MSSSETHPPERLYGLDTPRRTALAGALVAILLVFGAAAPVMAQTPAGPGGCVRPAAPGLLVEVALDRRLHIFCKGDLAGQAWRQGRPEQRGPGFIEARSRHDR